MLSKELLDDLRQQQIDDPGLQALLIAYDAMYHDLATSAGLWCVDHKPENEPDAFQLTHQSIHREKVQNV